MNECKFIGRMTKDPEFKVTQSGVSIVTFDLAVQRKFKNKQTNEYESDFIRCIAFKNTAEFINNYAKKGYVVAVGGEMRNNNYEDQNGVKHYGMQMIVDNVDATVLFMNNKQEKTQEAKKQAPPQNANNGNPFDNAETHPGDPFDNMPF